MKKVPGPSIIVISVLLLSIALILPGCATWGKSSKNSESEEGIEAGMPVAMDLRFDDIPVPKGFKFRKENSFAFDNEALRVALLRYVGRSRRQQIQEFYKDQMPLYNWQMINSVDYGKIILTYEKARELCIITIEPTTTRTALTIAISPRSQGKSKE